MLLSSLAALALSPLLIANPVDDPARLLPADTLMYFGSTSLHAGWAAGKNTAMAQILAEPEVRSFLHQPLTAANSVLSSGLQMISGEIAAAQQAAAEMGVGSNISIDNFELTFESGEPPLGQVFFALTHFTMPGMDGNEGPLPDVGFVFGVELLDDGMVSQLKQLWEAIPADGSKGSHAGVEYLSKAIPEAPLSAHLVFLDNLAVISISTQAIEGMIDQFQSGGASLASTSDYQKMLAAAGGLLPGGSSSFLRIDSIANLARMGLAMGMAMDSSVPAEDQAKILSIFDSLGLGAIGMVGGVSAVSSDGMIYTTSVLSIDENAPGLVAKLLSNGTPVDLATLDSMPADSISASAGSVGSQLVDIYDFAWDVIKQESPEQAKAMEAQLSAILGGVDLRNDLLANVSGSVTAHSTAGQGMMGTPDNTYEVGLRDPGRFITALGSILDSISAQVGMPLSLKESDLDGSPFYEIDISATPAGMMMQPAFAIRDGRMILGSNSRGLKSFLANGIGDAPALSSNEHFMSFVNGLAARGDLETFSFDDVAEAFGSSYSGMVGMAQMLPMSNEIPVDLAKLPPGDVISQHLRESYSGSYSAQGGLHVARSVSQFQLMDFVPFALVAGAIYAGTQVPQLAPAATEPEVDPADQARTDLRELKASITVYKISSSGYPESLADLLKPLGSDFPQGAYPHDELPVDPWGNPYSFAMEMHPRKQRLMPKLWSFGPNGIDEAGGGDDILKF